MSMEITMSSAPQDTVAARAGLCWKSFEVCLHEAARIHPRELSMIEDQLSRFSLWTSGIRVFGQSRQSLDHRLREAPEVRDLVLTLLEALIFRLEDCASTLQSLRSLQNAAELHPIDPSLLLVINHITSQISMLHKFSNTIRRASKHSGNIKAATDYVIKNDNGDDLGPFLRSVFLLHMRDSFPQMAENLRERLASTMLLRWKRVLYRRSRYGNSSIQITLIPQQPDTKLPTTKSRIVNAQPRAARNNGDNERRSAVPSYTQSATTLAIDSFQKASAPSVVSNSRTVAMPRHSPLRFPPAPTWIIEKKYRQLKAQKQPSGSEPPIGSRAPFSEKTQRRTDPLWTEALLAVGEITCPYCFYTLPAMDITNERKWALHVKSDLDPYVCLFEECESPNELYARSADWLKHMKGHALRWRCASKAHPEHVSTSRAEYIDHMKTAHNSRLSDNQLRIMADRSGRSIGPLFSCCPLCDHAFDQDDQQLEEHIVSHLRELAIKSLPPYYDEWDGNKDSDDQTSALSVARTRSTVKEERAVLTDNDEVIHREHNFQRDDISNFSDSCDQYFSDSKVQAETKSPQTSALENLTKIPLREIQSLIGQDQGQSLADWQDDVKAATNSETYDFQDSRVPKRELIDEQQPDDPVPSLFAALDHKPSLNNARELSSAAQRNGDKLAADAHNPFGADRPEPKEKNIWLDKFKLPPTTASEPPPAGAEPAGLWRLFGPAKRGVKNEPATPTQLEAPPAPTEERSGDGRIYEGSKDESMINRTSDLLDINKDAGPPPVLLDAPTTNKHNQASGAVVTTSPKADTVPTDREEDTQFRMNSDDQVELVSSRHLGPQSNSTQLQDQSGSSGASAAPVTAPQPGPNQVGSFDPAGMEFPINMDFANPTMTTDVLQDFDFNSFLHDDDDGTPFGFDPSAFGMEGADWDELRKGVGKDSKLISGRASRRIMPEEARCNTSYASDDDSRPERRSERASSARQGDGSEMDDVLKWENIDIG